MTSHSTVSKPSSSVGRPASVVGSHASSSLQGIWMISFTVLATKGKDARAAGPEVTDSLPRHGAAVDQVRVRRALRRDGRRRPGLSDLSGLRLVLLAALGPRDP